MSDTAWLENAKRWVQEADAVLIVAGAGISVGLGPKEDEGWDGRQPQTEGGAMDWARSYGRSGAAVMWGTEAPRLLRTARYWGKKHHKGFEALLRLVKEEKRGNYFIYTVRLRLYRTPKKLIYPHSTLASYANKSNVDHRFHYAGFDGEKIYTPQGDMTLLQCAGPCAGHAWDCRPVLAKLVEEGEIDATTGLSAKIDASDIHSRFVKRVEDIPTCPRCGVMPAYKHTHHNSLFTHGPHDAHQDRMMEFLEALRSGGGSDSSEKTKENKKKLLVLEVGVGFQTPSVCRWPCEAIVRDLATSSCEAKLLRLSLSPTDAAVPPDLQGRAIGIVGEAERALVELCGGSAGNSADIDEGGTLLSLAPSVVGLEGRRLFAPAGTPYQDWLLRLRDDPRRFSQ